MSSPDYDALLQAAVDECDAAGCPLTGQQQSILIRMLLHPLPNSTTNDAAENPLDALEADQQHALLEFIAEQEQQSRNWKAQLLNDWVAGQDSGAVQFIRDQYGLQWLERVRPSHVSQYARPTQIQVGDRIEVSNSLWEWVQEDGPCQQEWFPCTVVSLSNTAEIGGENGTAHTNCIIRFDNGMEYEIQGVYEWNRYSWRWCTVE